MNNAFETGYFTFDKLMGLEKRTCYTKTIMEAINIFDKANEDLYNELVRVKEENKMLKMVIKKQQEVK